MDMLLHQLTLSPHDARALRSAVENELRRLDQLTDCPYSAAYGRSAEVKASFGHLSDLHRRLCAFTPTEADAIWP